MVQIRRQLLTHAAAIFGTERRHLSTNYSTFKHHQNRFNKTKQLLQILKQYLNAFLVRGFKLQRLA